MQQKHCNTAGRESTAKTKRKCSEGKSSALTKFELFSISKCTFCLWQTATTKVRDTQSDSSPKTRTRPTDGGIHESGAKIRERGDLWSLFMLLGISRMRSWRRWARGLLGMFWGWLCSSLSATMSLAIPIDRRPIIKGIMQMLLMWIAWQLCLQFVFPSSANGQCKTSYLFIDLGVSLFLERSQ